MCSTNGQFFPTNGQRVCGEQAFLAAVKPCGGKVLPKPFPHFFLNRESRNSIHSRNTTTRKANIIPT